MLSAIVAMAHNRVIGSQNDIPWYLPADLKHFKELTIGHPVIMGRKTCESIIARLGHALPNRENIVITRGMSYSPAGFSVVHSVSDVLTQIGDRDAFVIGGAQIYELMIDKFDRLYITEIDAEIPGDTYFPAVESDSWREVARVANTPDDRNPYLYSFIALDRIK